MKVIKIKQQKQDNGLWGTPYNCHYIESSPWFDNRKMIIFSAAVAAVNEKFNSPFSIIYCDQEGFRIRTQNGNLYRVCYDEYEVVDDTIYKFDNEQEHITFLRQHKLKKLQNEM
jgi:hypothetical protein